MPLYEYQCDACAHRFEVIQKFSDPPIDVCPKCGGTVKKLLSSPAIQFKGTGWYITDYSQKGKAPAESSASKTDGKDGTSKGETAASDKPAADKPASSEAAKPAAAASKPEA